MSNTTTNSSLGWDSEAKGIYRWNCLYGCFASADSEPWNINEALANSSWKQAMDSKFHALLKKKTWHLVPPQKGINIIDCK
jgi:hypothetical protein